MESRNKNHNTVIDGLIIDQAASGSPGRSGSRLISGSASRSRVVGMGMSNGSDLEEGGRFAGGVGERGSNVPLLHYTPSNSSSQSPSSSPQDNRQQYP